MLQGNLYIQTRVRERYFEVTLFDLSSNYNEIDVFSSPKCFNILKEVTSLEEYRLKHNSEKNISKNYLFININFIFIVCNKVLSLEVWIDSFLKRRDYSWNEMDTKVFVDWILNDWSLYDSGNMKCQSLVVI